MLEQSGETSSYGASPCYRVERIYKVLPPQSKESYAKATQTLGDRLHLAGRLLSLLHNCYRGDSSQVKWWMSTFSHLKS